MLSGPQVLGVSRLVSCLRSLSCSTIIQRANQVSARLFAQLLLLLLRLLVRTRLFNERHTIGGQQEAMVVFV